VRKGLCVTRTHVFALRVAYRERFDTIVPILHPVQPNNLRRSQVGISWGRSVPTATSYSAWSSQPQTAWKCVPFRLGGLTNADMRDVIIVALTAEGIPAALHSTIRANRGSTVSALGCRRLAARCPVVAIARHVFDLAIGGHAALFNCANSANSLRMRSPAHSNS
jgi:hypothetical protein